MEPTGEITKAVFEEMQAGNREAFDRFFERYTARVLVYISYNMGPRLRQKLEPADILQEIYLDLYRNFESFSEKAGERGIQRAIVRMADHAITEAYRYHFKVEKRDARREVIASYLEDEKAGGSHPLAKAPSKETSLTQRVVRQEEYRRVMDMLADLSPLEQYITVSRVIEGLSSREIAEALGKSRGAVQMIFSRVRDKLRKRAARGGGDRGNRKG